MKVAVIRFPGSNCDEDARDALERCGAEARLRWHRESDLGDAEAVVIPGGFSYGDHLRSGAMAAHSPIMAAVRRFAEDGGPVLGICNGFQILTECGLLPGALLPNDGLAFVCRTVEVRVERSEEPFTSGYRRGQVLRLPIAHGEGRYHADPATLAELERSGRVVFRYCDRAGATAPGANPNGSAAAIAGIVNEAGNVLGMMPHPERAVEALLGSTDGRALFASLLGAASHAVPA